MVVIEDGHGGKVVIYGRDGRTDGQSCPLAIGRVRVKTELHAQVSFLRFTPC
jgi:hypothetical protein